MTGVLSAQQTDTVDASEYFVIGENPMTAWVYIIGDAFFFDYFQAGSAEIKEKTYAMRVRKYSTGGVDTTYYREGDDGFYHIRSTSPNETLTLPKKAYVGKKWFEADSSWSYRVTNTSASIDTYKDLIVVKAMQIKGDAAMIGTTYDMYFAKGLGMIATKKDEKIVTYLKEFKHPQDTTTDTEK